MILVVIIAIAVVFATVSLALPQSMATMFENMGIYSFATGYAGLAYKYSRTVESLARCVDDSIFAKDEANVINYGDKLVARDDFKEYSEQRTKEDIERAKEDGVDMQNYSYYHFVYSNLACAKYSRGDKDGALETAKVSMQDVSDFPENNAFGALAIRAVKNLDYELAIELYREIIQKTPTTEQTKYYNSVLEILIIHEN